MKKAIFQRIAILLAVIALGSSSAWAAIVTGTVTEASTGDPLIGVTVRVKNNAKLVVATDIDGNYRLDVPNAKTDVLVFSYVGMTTKEESVNGRSVVNVELAEDSEMLDEVVVVGYGQQKKASVVGAITQASGEVLERAAGIHDLSQALTGNLPGVVTMTSSGMPGDESAEITIRGASSWNNSKPLVLIDGIERDMSQVDVSSVKNVSVLKDASATAVYGVKGANGVVLITTRRGEEGAAKIDVGFTTTLKSVSKLPAKADSYDALRLRNTSILHELALNPSSWGYMTSLDELNKYRNPANLEEFERYPNVDWQDELFKRTAMSYNGNVAVSGGTKFVKYFAVIDYVHEGDLFREFDNGRGYEPGFGYDRINARSNLDFQITPYTVFKVNIAGSSGQKKSTQPQDRGSSFNQANWNDQQMWNGVYNLAPDVFRPQYSDGSYGYYPQFASQTTNPVRLVSTSGVFKATTTRINTDFTLEQDLSFLTKGLNFRGMISWDNVFVESKRGVNDFDHPSQMKWINPVTGAVSLSQNLEALNQFDFSQGVKWNTLAGEVDNRATMRNLNYQLQLNWYRSFGEHDLGLTGVWTRQEMATGNMTPIHREDWVFRATYNFADRYFAEYNGAYNGSEKFGKGFRYGFFNSGAIGWRISEEKFWRSLQPWFNELKVRASIGQIGDDTGARFLYMDQWAYGGMTMMNTTAPNYWDWENGSLYQYYRRTLIGNPDINWEKVTKYNLGIDFGFLNSMLAGTFELFKDKRKDILINGNDRAIPSFFGETPATVNKGRAEAKGFELELRFNKSFGRDWRVWANASITHAENKIIDRDDPALKPAYQKQAGYAIGQVHSYIDRGFVNTWDEIIGSPTHNSQDANRLPGDYYIVDFNGDGVVDDQDNVPYGYTGTPQNTYNCTFGFDWKGLSFFAQFYGVNNVTREVALTSFANNLDNVYDLGDWYNPETQTGDVIIPRWYTQYSSGTHNGTQYQFDGSYIRLKNIEVSYTFTAPWVKKIGLGSLRVYLNGNNLWVWSRMPDDRESNFSGSSSSGAYPTVKRFNLGIKFNL